MSESTTDKPTTGKNVGGFLRPGVPMSPNARRVLDAINDEHFDGDFAALAADEEKPAARGPLYLVRPQIVPAENRSKKVRAVERLIDELRDHMRTFRRSDNEGDTAQWLENNHILVSQCIDRLPEFHNDVAAVLGHGETFTRTTPSESRPHMLTDEPVHTVPHFVEFTMALRGQSAHEYFNEPPGVRHGLEQNVTNALKVIGCTLTPTACDHTTPACDHVPGAAEKTDLKQAFEDSSGDRDPGAKADAEAHRHATAVRAQYAVGSMSKDARRGLLDVLATLHPKLVLDAITDVNTARRHLDHTLDGWQS